MILMTNQAPQILRALDKTIVRLPIDAILPNPYQPRRFFDETALAELAESIRAVGLLQPVTVRRAAGAYELVAGERRLRACRLAGITHVDAIVMTAREQESAMLALIENIQREDLSFLEEADAYQALIRDHGMTQEQLARRLARNQSTIANKLRLLKLSDEHRALIASSGLTERHARALLRLGDEGERGAALQRIIARQLNVRQSEELIETAVQKREAEAKQKNRVARVICRVIDPRLYINSILAIVDQMKNAGFVPELNQLKDETGIVITLRIPVLRR